MSSNRIMVENVNFRAAGDHDMVNDGGSMHLGYVTFDLAYPHALPNGGDSVITLKDGKVRINCDRDATYAPGCREWVDDSGTKRYNTMYRLDEQTHAFLVRCLFAERQVRAAFRRAVMLSKQRGHEFHLSNPGVRGTLFEEKDLDIEFEFGS